MRISGLQGNDLAKAALIDHNEIRRGRTAEWY